MTLSYSSFEVDVDGGTVHVGRWGGGDRVLVAVHGITGNHMAFAPLAEALGPEHTIIAPDLRGRGGSLEAGGPYGMARHASDVVKVMDHAGVRDAVVCGHSMGGFVAAVLAHAAPERVRSLILLDGGLPFEHETLTDMSTEERIRVVLGPALERLRMTFASAEDYLDFWKKHPALKDDWNEHMAGMYRYDLGGEPPNMRARVSEDAVLSDARDLSGEDVLRAVDGLHRPTRFVWAPRGLLDQEPGAYTEPTVARWRSAIPELEDVLIPDVNHYTLVLTDRGAAAVAGLIRSAPSQLG